MRKNRFIVFLILVFAGAPFSGCLAFLRPHVKKEAAPVQVAAAVSENAPAKPRFYPGKTKKYYLVGLNKELLEFRNGNLAVFFEPGTFEGFLLEKKEGSCLIHRLSIYDLSGDGEYDSVYLDRHLFYKSKFLSDRIFVPEGFTEGEAYLFIAMANTLANEYKKFFSNKDVEIAYLTNVKTVHDLVLSFYYYEAYSASCQDYFGSPDLKLMQNFFPAANQSSP